MSDWDSPYLVSLFKDKAGIPTASEYDDSADICPRLARAQLKVVRAIAAIWAKGLYGAPVQIFSSDSGHTFGFGNDGAGNVQVPMGVVWIAPNLNAFSGDTFSGWVEGRDFLNEGPVIRIPSNRTWSGTLYARFISTPPSITLTQPSTLNPAHARSLIVTQAALDFGAEGNGNPALRQTMADEWARDFPVQMLSWRRTYPSGGIIQDPGRWYFTTPDLGSGNRNA